MALASRARRDGVVGLADAERGPKGAWKLTDQAVAEIVTLHGQGHSGRAIGRQVGVDEKSVRQVIASQAAATVPAPAAPDTHEGRHDDVPHETVDGGVRRPEGELELLARPEARTADRQAPATNPHGL